MVIRIHSILSILKEKIFEKEVTMFRVGGGGGQRLHALNMFLTDKVKDQNCVYKTCIFICL